MGLKFTINLKNKLATYGLENFTKVHRNEQETSFFGSAKLPLDKRINGFEIYSTEGVREVIEPLKSDFFRISVCVKGTVKTRIGLDDYTYKRGSMSFTYPNQIFSVHTRSDDFFGYYILIDSTFLTETMTYARLSQEFKFLTIGGRSFLNLRESTLNRVLDLFKLIDVELKANGANRRLAIQSYLKLILIEVKRNFEIKSNKSIVSQKHTLLTLNFLSQIEQYFLSLRNVSDYAQLLNVTPNHLNKTIKKDTGNTASFYISRMLVLEAKTFLRHSNKSNQEISDYLGFGETSSFNRFFKRMEGITPIQYKSSI